MYVKGYSAPETKAAVEQARLLIEQAEAFGEPPKIRCCYSGFSMASTLQPISLLTVMFAVISLHKSCRSPRNKPRRLVHSYSLIA